MQRRGLRVIPPSVGLLVAVVIALAGSGPMEGSGPPRERVTIRRDTYGIPHILAKDIEAAGYGFGYAQAEDHAEELGRRYMAGRGDAARVFGRGLLDGDIAVRRLKNRDAARRALGTLGKGFRTWLHGFVAGVNAYVARHRDTLPAWMPTVDESDVLAYGRLGAATSALEPPRALLDKYPAATPPRSGSLTEDDPSALDERNRPNVHVPVAGAGVERSNGAPEEHEADGSNAFALAGSRTVSGHPLLLGNPHLAWTSRYWEAHVTVPGKLDFFGSTLVGIPVLRAGFNDRLGYVQTNNYPDLEDIYRLPLDPASSDRYVFNGRSQPLTTVRVTVPVRRDDGQVIEETREFWQTEIGPVIHRTDRYVFVVRSVALEAWRSYEGFYELAFSRSLGDFRRRLARNLHYFSNFTYADSDGNIFYQWNARLPKRPEPSLDYSLDVPVDSKGALWHSFYKVRELPCLLNPSGGYVQNANNPPWWTSLRNPIDSSPFPSSVERTPLGLRPQLVLDELERRDKLTPDDVLDVKFTTRMLVAERVMPDLLAALDRAERVAGTNGADLQEARRVLASWDRHVAKDSRGAVLFQQFWDRYREGRTKTFAEEFDPAHPLQTPRGLADPDAAISALARAVVELRTQYGALDVAWGEVHRFRFGPLDLPADGAPSMYGTYRVLAFEPDSAGRRVAGRLTDERPLVGNGDAWILLVHFTRPVQAWSVLAYGETTRPESPHYRDQIELFASHRLRPVWYTEADIRAHLSREYEP